MNTYTIYLSSPTTAYTATLPQIVLDDHTELTLNTEQLAETTVPVYLKIDWGDSSDIVFNNPFVFQNNLNVLKFTKLLNAEHVHQYYPSTTALYKTITAQILVVYSNTTITYIRIPIVIRTYGYTESIEDMNLVNTNILPIDANTSEHQFKTQKDRYIIELRKD